MTIRTIKRADYDAVLAIYNFYVLNTPYNFDLRPQTVISKSEWFEQFKEKTKYQCLVLCNEDNTILGFCYSSPFSQAEAYASSVNIGCYCHHEFLGQGLGRKLIDRLLKVLEGRKIHKFFGGITVPNYRSERLLTYYGFRESHLIQEVGFKFGRYWNVKWFEKKAPYSQL